MDLEDTKLPVSGKNIVYYLNGFRVGEVDHNIDGKLMVYNGYRYVFIKTGLLWCYQNDIIDPKQRKIPD